MEKTMIVCEVNGSDFVSEENGTLEGLALTC